MKQKNGEATHPCDTFGAIALYFLCDVFLCQNVSTFNQKCVYPEQRK